MTEFHLTQDEVTAVAISYDELLSYVETTGDEGSLDDEEMPNGKLRWTLERLREVLDRYANYEHLVAMSKQQHSIIEEPVIRFEVRSTPPSGSGEKNVS